MWMTGMAAAKNPTSSMTMCPDRRSASTSVPYRKTARTSSAVFEGSAFDIPRTMSSVMCSVSKRIESRDVTTRIAFCFIRDSVNSVAATHALEQPACDEGRNRAAERRFHSVERRLHLPEQMQVVAAHRQNGI